MKMSGVLKRFEIKTIKKKLKVTYYGPRLMFHRKFKLKPTTITPSHTRSLYFHQIVFRLVSGGHTMIVIGYRLDI